MVIGEKPFYYPYFQFGQSESTVANYISGHAIPTDAPILNYDLYSCCYNRLCISVWKPLSLAASPQDQVGKTKDKYIVA
jgi:hypothetical protein